MGEDTSIRIKRSTKKKLDMFGRKNETYDDLIKRLLNEVEDCRAKLG